MIAKRLCILFLACSVTLLVTSSVQTSHSQAPPTLKPDGGHPVPPWPYPPSGTRTLSTSQTANALLADGGHPVPPWPYPSNATQTHSISHSSIVLLADGGHPVPPWPYPSSGLAHQSTV